MCNVGEFEVQYRDLYTCNPYATEASDGSSEAGAEATSSSSGQRFEFGSSVGVYSCEWMRSAGNQCECHGYNCVTVLVVDEPGAPVSAAVPAPAPSSSPVGCNACSKWTGGANQNYNAVWWSSFVVAAITTLLLIEIVYLDRVHGHDYDTVASWHRDAALCAFAFVGSIPNLAFAALYVDALGVFCNIDAAAAAAMLKASIGVEGGEQRYAQQQPPALGGGAAALLILTVLFSMVTMVTTTAYLACCSSSPRHGRSIGSKHTSDTAGKQLKQGELRRKFKRGEAPTFETAGSASAIAMASKLNPLFQHDEHAPSAVPGESLAPAASHWSPEWQTAHPSQTSTPSKAATEFWQHHKQAYFPASWSSHLGRGAVRGNSGVQSPFSHFGDGGGGGRETPTNQHTTHTTVACADSDSFDIGTQGVDGRQQQQHAQAAWPQGARGNQIRYRCSTPLLPGVIVDAGPQQQQQQQQHARSKLADQKAADWGEEGAMEELRQFERTNASAGTTNQASRLQSSSSPTNVLQSISPRLALVQALEGNFTHTRPGELTGLERAQLDVTGWRGAIQRATTAGDVAPLPKVVPAVRRASIKLKEKAAVATARTVRGASPRSKSPNSSAGNSTRYDGRGGVGGDGGSGGCSRSSGGGGGGVGGGGDGGGGGGSEGSSGTGTWLVAYDPNGTAYYYNTSTLETSWTAPSY